LARCPSRLAGRRAWPEWRTDNEHRCKENWARGCRRSRADRNSGCDNPSPSSSHQSGLGCCDWVRVVCARGRACQSVLRLGLSSLRLWVWSLSVLRLRFTKVWIRVRGLRSLSGRLLRLRLSALLRLRHGLLSVLRHLLRVALLQVGLGY